jgi:SNF2 family DNA or RNA helicase
MKGDTPKEKRAHLVERFNNDKTQVFLISLKAGGTGLNLIGADVVVHYDPWWNVAAQDQATDRAHRIGQKRNVQVYKLAVKESIEEKILKLQQSKKELADAIISEQGSGTSLITMTKEDLIELLS